MSPRPLPAPLDAALSVRLDEASPAQLQERLAQAFAGPVAPASRLPFNAPSIVGGEIRYILDALALGQISGDGTYTKKCHALLNARFGFPFSLLTHSCTAGLEMAVLLADVGPGDEVILPSYTFVSTANAIALRGGVPVFVDIDPATLNVDPTRVAAAVTARTKAIMAVHYAGYPCDMDALAAMAQAHGLLLIEDAAQALGSTYKGRQAGMLGDMAAFSFHETKNIVSGEGGALIVNNPALRERAEIIREKGTNRSRFFRGEVDKYTWVDIGSSYLPGELIAAFLYGQLEQFDGVIEARQAYCARYLEAFAPIFAAGLAEPPRVPPDGVSNGHMFYLLMKNAEQRAAFIAYMKALGIITPFHYVPLHSAPGGLKYARSHGAMTATDDIAERLVRLPLFYALGDRIEQVITATLNYFGCR
jgi:dTDP-4-amino-4,6-dideoxygalactose transaminase